MARATSSELAEIALLSKADQEKALAEIANRPTTLPLNQRAWPYGLPDRMQPGNNF